MVDHVLSAFAAADRPEVEAMIDRAADAVMAFIADGLERTMSRFN